MKDYQAELKRVSLINKCAKLIPETIEYTIKSNFYEAVFSSTWAKNTLPGGFTDKIHYRNKQIERLTYERDPVTPEYLNTKIVYTFDNNGFRVYPEYKPESKYTVYAFGCSYTFGMSLPDEHTWPYLLANKLGKWNVKNYGMGGAGASTISRICYQVINALKDSKLPDLVVVFLPITQRIEYLGNIDDNLYYKLIYKTTNTEHIGSINDTHNKEHMFFEYSSNMHCFFDTVTSLILLKETLESKKIKWFWYTWDYTFYKIDKDLISLFLGTNTLFTSAGMLHGIKRGKDKARDGSHTGLPYMTDISDLFYKLYKSN